MSRIVSLALCSFMLLVNTSVYSHSTETHQERLSEQMHEIELLVEQLREYEAGILSDSLTAEQNTITQTIGRQILEARMRYVIESQAYLLHLNTRISQLKERYAVASEIAIKQYAGKDNVKNNEVDALASLIELGETLQSTYLLNDKLLIELWYADQADQVIVYAIAKAIHDH